MKLCTKYNRVVLAERVTTACDLQSTTSLYSGGAETRRDGSKLGEARPRCKARQRQGWRSERRQGAERSKDTLYESGHVRLTKDRTKP